MEILALIFEFLTSGIMPFIILLGVLIFVHELGHFATAKYFGVRVETFSIGFGKKLFHKKHGDTTYAISLIPLGGYVKMFGDDPTKEIPEEEKKYSFLHQPVWPRIWIVAAGPLVNFFFAIIVFGMIAMVGEQRPGPEIGDISSGTAAYTAGFRSGDVITNIKGVNEPGDGAVSDWDQIKDKIQTSPDTTLDVTVKRKEESNPVSIQVVPKLVPNRNIISFYDEVGQIEGLTVLSKSTVIGVPDPNSILGRAGVKNLSLIEKVNGLKVEYWRDLGPVLKAAVKANNKIEITFSDYLDKEKKTDPKTAIVILDNQEELAGIYEADKLISAMGAVDPDTFLAGVKKSPSVTKRLLRAFGFNVKEDIENASPAYRAGLRQGDQIVAINSSPTNSWGDVLATVSGFKSEQKSLDFTIMRDGAKQDITVTPQMTKVMSPQGQEIERFTIGIYSAGASIASPAIMNRTLNPLKATYAGIYQSVRWTGLTLMSFVRLFQNKVSIKNVGGVITIGRVASQSFELGLSAFLKIMGIISINLFLLNLLPIPVLDGGHLVFFAIEAIKGQPLSLRKMEIAQTVGMVLLMSLMVFALFNDVNNWYSVQGW